MSDPTFTNRVDMANWIKARVGLARTLPEHSAALDDVRRVALAHLHLPWADDPREAARDKLGRRA